MAGTAVSKSGIQKRGVLAGGLPAPAWVEHLRLTQFRNYDTAEFTLTPGPIVVVGANGAGKTNLLEAVSLLSPGQGMRRVAYSEMAKLTGDGSWSVTAKVRRGEERITIGTGIGPDTPERVSGSRMVRLDGTSASPTRLSEFAEVLWLTPAMDGLFIASAGERRRFLDRLIASIDPEHRRRVAHFERAMRQRNRLLTLPRAKSAEFESLELQLAETGAAIAAVRRQVVRDLAATIANRAARDPSSPFPWASLTVSGTLEDDLAERAAVEVEDTYRERLEETRARDRAAGRTLIGPHLSDLVVGHGPKGMPAHLSSTGEQKALLVNLILGHAELVARVRMRPILLLDEITAHLDEARRSALFSEIIATGSQAWLTGTDYAVFADLGDRAQVLLRNASRR
jgi:DNA replication and repair protein RecF